MFLLDTNIISEMIKKTPDKQVMNKLKEHQNELYTASPVWHELNFGCQRLPESRRKKQIKSFLETVIRPTITILPYDRKAAQWHGHERARLSIIGLTPPFIDGQIAGIASVNDLTLVTRNFKDFKLFSNICMETWHQEK